MNNKSKHFDLELIGQVQSDLILEHDTPHCPNAYMYHAGIPLDIYM